MAKQKLNTIKRELLKKELSKESEEKFPFMASFKSARNLFKLGA